MRLLQVEDGESVSLVEFVGSSIPPYAILSHTWGEDRDEVNFGDAVNGIDHTKAGYHKYGYRKIRFCGQQASRDGLKYFWVDTCCIDKSSSAELSEAINSMFYWYQRAARCYVYLSDVSSRSGRTGQSLQKSRWFTRGWTLQELIAPTSVDFFSSEGEWMGSRNLLIRDIADITGISFQALQGRPLYQFSVPERISWAGNRQTKREEDAAYSLLGIFGIHMPLLYGEGRHSAFMRLQREIRESTKDSQLIGLSIPTGAAEPIRQPHNYHVPFDNLGSVEHEHQAADGQQKVLDSLRFSQIQERRHQIHEAHKETYRWILRSVSDRNHQWDNLAAWLSSPTEPRRIYWIHGKPGSGKSTMMRFLDQNVVTPGHMLPWTENKIVLSAQYFFWGPGSKLQKSTAGLLRALLVQLLEKQPILIPHVVNQKHWSAARTPENHHLEWTNADLRRTLYEYIQSVRSFAKVFLIIDGLDELDGPDEARDELVELLVDIANLENVKLCVSSRPWNIFRDAFGDFPQLKLEDLTQRDISSYAKAQLHSHVRFRYLYQRDRASAQSLIYEVTMKADGVFLWVRLVIRELLNGLRDGDGIHMLQKKLKGLPADLNQYFKGMMDSISLQQRQEASAFLQIALYEEDDFATGHSLRLIDLSFIDEGRPDFILNGQNNFTSFDLTEREALVFRLDSTFRRLNSRCMGLLECTYESDGRDDEDYSPTASPPMEGLDDDSQEARVRLNRSPVPGISQSRSSLLGDGLTVHFLHRSCRDFLLTPEIQTLLHEYTRGPYDARMFLLNARISLFVALATTRLKDELAFALASNIISSLGRPSYKNTPICTELAAVIQPTLENLIQNSELEEDSWYIYPSVASWHNERSSFLTLAIDFELSSYVQTHLTPEVVREKRGRPILDYILRPRFMRKSEWLKIGNRRPNLEFLTTVLHFGANPNEMYGAASVWAHFLSYLADVATADMEDDGVTHEYVGALELLIRAGAATRLPKSWLSYGTAYERYFHGIIPSEDDMELDERFEYRWPTVVPARRGTTGVGSQPWCAVSDLLEHLRSHLWSDVDTLKGLLNNGNSGLV